MNFSEYTKRQGGPCMQPPGIGMPYTGAGMQMQYPVQSMVSAMPAMPTGIPTGPSPTPVTAAVPLPQGEQTPQTLQSILFTPGYLRTQIGKRMRVEFLIGTNGPLVDRIGTLVGVGASYILLRPVESDDILLCDIYSIRFVTIYQ